MSFRALTSTSILALCLGLGGCASSGAPISDADGEASAETASTGSLARDYRGTVAGLDVMLRIDASGGRIDGSYFYVGKVTKGETLVLAGTAAAGRFTMVESVDGAKTGTWSGTIAASGTIRGTWTAPNGREHAFSLDPVKTVTLVPRAIKDSAGVSDPEAPFHTCEIDTKYVDVFGLPDAANEAALDKLLAMDASPLEKNAQGKCDWWNSLDSTSTVKLEEKGLLVVEMGSESDGGAYPNHSLLWVNASTKTGKIITLPDFVQADKLPALKDKVKAAYKASEEGADDFLLETIDNAFESPEDVQFELTKAGLRISMFNALPHAAQAEDGDGALLKWSDIKDMLIPTSDPAVLAN
jgi:hypothetical protein